MTLNSPMSAVRGIDHVLLRVDDPQPILTRFFEIFEWPVVWPITIHGAFASGGAFLGNATIEVVHLDRTDRSRDA